MPTTFPPSAPIRLGTAKHAVAASIGLAATAVRHFPRPTAPPAAARHAVLLEPYGLGDALSLLPLCHGLLHHGWKVTVCARATWREIFPSAVGWVDCRLPWTSYDPAQKYQTGSLVGPAMRSFLAELSDVARGAVGVDTRGDARSILLLWLARCDRVITLDHYLGYDLGNRSWAAELVPYDSSLRRWESNIRFLPALCPEAESSDLRFDLRTQWEGTFNHPPERTIGLIPLAPWLGKIWPAESWRSLIARLRADGWRVRGLAGPGQQEATATSLGLGMDEVTLCPTIEAWVRQLARVVAVVSVDTGPMHLADGLQVPLVALYGAGTLPLWAPSGHHSIALHRQHDTDYAPVHPTGSGIKRGQELMKRHTPEDVMAALSKVVGQSADGIDRLHE